MIDNNLHLQTCNTKQLTSISNMFWDCKIETLNIKGLSTNNVRNFDDAFRGGRFIDIFVDNNEDIIEPSYFSSDLLTPIGTTPNNAIDFSGLTSENHIRINQHGNIYAESNRDLSGVQIFSYDETSSSWNSLSDLPTPSVSFNYGASIDLNNSGDKIIIGDYPESGSPDKGYAQVSEWDGASWNQVGNLITGGENSGDFFGYNVAINGQGNTAAISTLSSGHIETFYLENENWIKIGDPITFNQNTELRSGCEIDFNDDGNILSINDGEVKVFEFDGQSWSQLGSTLKGSGCVASNQVKFQLLTSGSGAIDLDTSYGYLNLGGEYSEVTGVDFNIDSSYTGKEYLMDPGGSFERLEVFGHEVSLNSEKTHLTINLSGEFYNNYNATGYSINDFISIINNTNLFRPRYPDLSAGVHNFSYTPTNYAAGDNEIGVEALIFPKSEGGSQQQIINYHESLINSHSINSNGDTIVLGPKNSEVNNCGEAGLVQVLNFNGSDWATVGSFIQGDFENNEGFSVDINSNGSTIAITEKGPAENNASLKILEFTNSQWIQKGETLNFKKYFGIPPVKINNQGDKVTTIIAKNTKVLEIKNTEIQRYNINGLFDTKKGKDFSYMFYGNRFLKTFSKTENLFDSLIFNFKNAINLQGMFGGYVLSNNPMFDAAYRAKVAVWQYNTYGADYGGAYNAKSLADFERYVITKYKLNSSDINPLMTFADANSEIISSNFDENAFDSVPASQTFFLNFSERNLNSEILMDQIFQYASKPESIKFIKNPNFKNPIDSMNNSFEDNNFLRDYIDLRGFELTNLNSIKSCFANCYHLKNIYFDETFLSP
ncbi:hypothetical protein EB151_07335, partial [archaeon]|nr:hypothetical protein [archaeon]